VNLRAGLAACLVLAGAGVHAQELEPRRWSHLPVGTDYIGVGYLYTEGDILFDPVLRIEDADFEVHTFPAKYIHAFGLGDKSARVEFLGGYQDGHWEGLLDGEPRERNASGPADPIARFAINLAGTPALSGKKFADYRASAGDETIVGAALSVMFPFGQYDRDRLINLGQNRFAFRPQVGVVRTWGNWSAELDGSVWIFTDNDDFFGDQTREQEPIYSGVAHFVCTFRPGLWVGASGGYGYGGESTIAGDAKDDRQEIVAYGVALGIPIHRRAGVKVAYVGTRTQTDLGSDTDTLGAAVSFMW